MNNIARVFATAIIWGALTILGIAMTVSHITLSSGSFVFVLTALIIGATIGTLGVWNGTHTNPDVREEAEKSKRRSKVERLMNDLDDRDIDELRFRLMGENNDESIPLEDLMRAQKNR